MRILVTGSRDWDDRERILDALWAFFWDHDPVLVHGACPTGADAIAEQYADSLLWEIERHPADWAKYGKAAGDIRNQHMVNLGADICLAFIRNRSRGATQCAAMAEQAGIPVQRYEVTT